MPKLIRVVIIYFTLSVGPVWACTFDGVFNNPFVESYAGAFDVALATHNEVQKRTMIKPDKLDGQAGLRRASWLLTLFIQNQSRELTVGSYIYLVDRRLWSKIETDMKLMIHVDQPETSAPVLLMSEAALLNIVSNTIEFQSALDVGVVKRNSTPKS